MKEKPILFSGPMVRAILEGRKTQTRRVVKPQPVCADDAEALQCIANGEVGFSSIKTFPYQPGDHLWVRETFRIYHSAEECACYDACECSRHDGKPVYRATADDSNCIWKPSIFMRRWASRITLEVTEVRVQRVQDITEEDAIAEGCGSPITRDCKVPVFRALWDSINSKRGFGWDSNPWVWAITFKRIQ